MEPFDAGEIVGVRQVLDAPPDDLLAGVAEDVALPLVDTKPSTLEIEVADADPGVLERPSEPLLTFPQGRLGTLPFLGVGAGMGGHREAVAHRAQRPRPGDTRRDRHALDRALTPGARIAASRKSEIVQNVEVRGDSREGYCPLTYPPQDVSESRWARTDSCHSSARRRRTPACSRMPGIRCGPSG